MERVLMSSYEGMENDIAQNIFIIKYLVRYYLIYYL